jgi:hypothetical protein
MAPHFLTILTGRNLPKIRQPEDPASSIINDKTIADFARIKTCRHPEASALALARRAGLFGNRDED